MSKDRNLGRIGVVVALVIVGLGGCGEGDAPKRWSRPPGETPPPATPFRLAVASDTGAGGGAPRVMPSQGAAASGAGGMGMPAPADRGGVRATTGSLVAAGIGFMIPDGWIPEEPSSPVRLAQYRLPGSGGDAEMSVFAFGPGQGGTPKANIERWVGQFRNDEATTGSQPADVAELETGGLRLYLVRTSGTYTPTAMGMMGPPQEPKPDYALFGLVVEGGPQGLLFVKVTGPRQTMQEQNANLEAFALSAKRM